MRDGSRVPELCEDAAAGIVDGSGDAPPTADLLVRPEAGRIRPAESLRADGSGFANDESGGGALRVVLRLQGCGDMIARLRAHSGERSHHDTVGEIEVPHPIGLEEWLSRHGGKLLHG